MNGVEAEKVWGLTTWLDFVFSPSQLEALKNIKPGTHKAWAAGMRRELKPTGLPKNTEVLGPDGVWHRETLHPRLWDTAVRRWPITITELTLEEA